MDSHNMSCGWVYDQFVIFDFIAERDMASNAVALHGRLSHTTSDLLGQFGRVELSHALQDGLQNNPFRVL